MPESKRSARSKKIVNYSQYANCGSDDDDFSTHTPPPSKAANKSTEKSKRKPPAKRQPSENFADDLEMSLALSASESHTFVTTAEINICKQDKPSSDNDPPVLSPVGLSPLKRARASASGPDDEILPNPLTSQKFTSADDDSTDSEFHVAAEDSDQSEDDNPSDSDEDFGASNKKKKSPPPKPIKQSESKKQTPTPKASKAAALKSKAGSGAAKLKPAPLSRPVLTSIAHNVTSSPIAARVTSSACSGLPSPGVTSSARSALLSPGAGSLGMRRSWNPPGSCSGTPSPRQSTILSRSPASVARVGLSKLARVKPLHSTLK